MSESLLNRPGIGNEAAAQRIVEAFIRNPDGLTPEHCRKALEGSIVDAKGYDALNDALRDGFVTKDERAKLLEAGFSGRFVYALTDRANSGSHAAKERARNLRESGSDRWWGGSPSFEARQKAVDRLLEMGTPEAHRELLKMLDDMSVKAHSKHPAGTDLLATTIRASILEQGNHAIPSLRRALDDKDSRVQRMAVDLLAQLQSERATRVLAQKLGVCDSDLGSDIIGGLSRMDPSTVVRVLREDASRDARRTIRALSETPYGLGAPFSPSAARLHRLLTESATTAGPARRPAS